MGVAYRDLLELGLSVYLGEKIRDSNRQQTAQREQGLPVTPTPFVKMFRRWAKAKEGKDISKFI